MLSAGNDIVSLKGIDIARTKQYNFYSKILTPTETALHSQPCFSATPFEVFVWLLWSIKESLFKFLQRIKPDVLFTPVKFEVKEIHAPEAFTINNFNQTLLKGIGFDQFTTITSVIKFENSTCYSKSIIYNELIATVVNADENFNNTHWGIKQIDSTDTEIQSAEVRKFAIASLQQALGDKRVTISKNKHNVPVALQNQAKAIPVSLSHHENWVGYSFQI
ncbi:4'-phosphopantetheinyl transferase family protein [Mucilaginibacter sp.]